MLDTNVYCRPYDDIEDSEILRESIAIFKIMKLAINNQIEIITSDLLIEELKFIENQIKRNAILAHAQLLSTIRLKIDSSVIKLADRLETFIKDYADALHLSVAAHGECSFFITCDNELIKKADKIERFLISQKYTLSIINPRKFVEDEKQ